MAAICGVTWGASNYTPLTIRLTKARRSLVYISCHRLKEYALICDSILRVPVTSLRPVFGRFAARDTFTARRNHLIVNSRDICDLVAIAVCDGCYCVYIPYVFRQCCEVQEIGPNWVRPRCPVVLVLS